MASKKAKKGPGKIAGKQIRKQVRSLKGDVKDMKKGVAREVSKATKGLASQNKAIKAEFAKLTSEMKNLQSKKAPKRELSMYNLFVRQQIKQGKTFEEAVKAWKSSSKIIANPELAKKGKTKTRTITKTKVVVRRVKAKTPAPVVKQVVRTQLPAKAQESLKSILKELSALKTEVNQLEKEAPPMPKLKGMPMMNEEGLSDEEVAVRLTRLYFEEIARLGFKRRLDFDAIINAYYYCLQRLQNKDKELGVMRKLVEREEAKLPGEPKSSLFPSMQE